ncbi:MULTISPECIES: hypothetical protein [Amycolatopsis]|nr:MULTISPECIES: hypothetical protein [Amycolatopsis]
MPATHANTPTKDRRVFAEDSPADRLKNLALIAKNGVIHEEPL